jgi:hypothetical protein
VTSAEKRKKVDWGAVAVCLFTNAQARRGPPACYAEGRRFVDVLDVVEAPGVEFGQQGFQKSARNRAFSVNG